MARSWDDDSIRENPLFVAKRMKTLLLDLTSLDTPSRTRGSGRYVRELAVGLSRLSPAERSGV
ncbi:MAG TPA: hypothetical protein VKP30_23010, partial [Polyangiaceae bacterium]|nr:hypothetical protein [Polyangiaceae bacterium]